MISRNGRSTRHREWQDTVLISPREKVEIAFVADNPGAGCSTATFSNTRPAA